MRCADCWAGGVIALFGTIAIHAAWPLEFWSEFGPGPGFFPLLLGTALILMGSVVAAGGWLSRKAEADVQAGFRKPLLVAAIMAGYLASLNFLGFPVATVLFLFTLIYGVESRPAFVSLVLAVFITLGLYLVFDTLLKTSLPLGMLQWIS